jgi:hypothetical protein
LGKGWAKKQPFGKRLSQKTTFWKKVEPKNNLLGKGWAKKYKLFISEASGEKVVFYKRSKWEKGCFYKRSKWGRGTGEGGVRNVFYKLFLRTNCFTLCCTLLVKPSFSMMAFLFFRR